MSVRGTDGEERLVDDAFSRGRVRCGWLLALVGCLLAGGCAGDRELPAPSDGAFTAGTNAVRYPLVKPVLKLSGRVLSVNAKLRFAVLDFGFNPPPADQSLLEVVREGRSVGELRVNGPASGSLLVADLVRGEVAPGDEVRPR